MSLTVLENQFRIKIANDDFYNTLHRSSVKFDKGKVLFQIYQENKLEYFYRTVDIHFLKALNFWFSRIEKGNRSIYAFGINEPNNVTNVPICTIDFSISGINKNTNAVFAQDKHGKVSVLYRVNQKQLTSQSLELDSEGEWIQALERDKTEYFILMGELHEKDFLNTFKEFLNQIERISDLRTENTDGNLDNPKSCSVCGKTILSTESNYNSIITELGIKNSDYCTDCKEKMAAAIALKKIRDKINLKLFNKKNLLERVDNPDVFESYLELLVGLGILKEMSKDLLILDKDIDMDEIINEFQQKSEIPPEQPPEPTKKCVKCGVVLSSENSFKSNGLSEICKDCSRKIYAVKALNQIEKYVVPDFAFSKDDLLKQVDNRLKFLDYIWTLQEFDLLKKDEVNDTYILKPEEYLIKFKTEYGSGIKESTNVNAPKETKTVKKVVKECEVCKQVLPISKFYKSSISEDGHTDKCKDCSRKSYAAKALLEIKKYVIPDVEFYKEDLLKQADNRTQFLDYFWTLQEFDFIEYNEKTDRYILTPEKEINSFIRKYGENNIIKEEPPGKKEAKTVKKCNTCTQTLPISDFYKSSESDDGYTENCKKCSDKINAANILKEIKEYIGIGNPFSKKELSNQLGNPTKVDYYIWTLQGHDLIDHDEKTDTYVVEDGSTYEQYKTLLDQLNTEKTSETSPEISVDSDVNLTIDGSEEIFDIKEIIYNSENSNNNKTIILRAIIQKNNLFFILNNIKGIITSNIVNMTLNQHNEHLLKLVIELDISNDSYEEILKSLEDNDWDNKTGL